MALIATLAIVQQMELHLVHLGKLEMALVLANQDLMGILVINVYRIIGDLVVLYVTVM